jgi:imidazolonepropionase-like amidohydrolase
LDFPEDQMTPARALLVSASILACTGLSILPQARVHAQTEAAAESSETLYRNASVWTGDSFVRRDLAVRDGRFVTAASVGANAARVDLAGRFLVPAYGNAHCHIATGTEEASKFFLDLGVFYAWNPNTRVIDEEQLALIARPESFDVLTAQGGITEPGGHPDFLYREILHDRVYPTWKDEDFVGNMYHFGSTHAEIVAALDKLVSQHADFVKIYLLHSEDYERRKTDPRFRGRAGLDPLNVPFLVQEARRRGLFVAAHVETIADLRAAAISGVSVAAHLPGYAVLAEGDEPATIALTAEDAALVKRAGMRVVPTYALATLVPPGLEGAELGRYRERQETTFAVQSENLKLLHAAGVPILAGTDMGPAIFDEVEHWAKLGLPQREVLTAALASGAHLFTARRIGCFEPGCEADFLALAADPLSDLQALRNIELKVKAGRPLP